MADDGIQNLLAAYGLTEDDLDAMSQYGTWGAKSAALGQRRSLADALRGTPMPQGRQVGRIYVGPNPLEIAASTLNQIQGGRQLKAIEGEETAGLEGMQRGAGVAQRLKLAAAQAQTKHE